MNTITDRLRVAALPLDIVWGDKAANLAAVGAAMEHLPAGTDIVALPELFTTGYSDDPLAADTMAETNGGDTVEHLRRLARRYECAFAGTFLARTANRLYNRAFFIEPNGDETFYDKRHLFSLSSEAKIFTAGAQRPPVVRFRGWNIAMVVCYDLRFPVWCRCRRLAYDLLLVLSNWPQARGYAYEHLLIARAIENQCAVVGANRGGKDVYGNYDGLCRIYDCRGYELPPVDDAAPFVAADLSLQTQNHYRTTFPAGNDADDFDFIDAGFSVQR